MILTILGDIILGCMFAGFYALGVSAGRAATRQEPEDNIAMCRQHTGLPVLACIPDGAQELPMEPNDLAALYEEVSLT